MVIRSELHDIIPLEYIIIVALDARLVIECSTKPQLHTRAMHGPHSGRSIPFSLIIGALGYMYIVAAEELFSCGMWYSLHLDHASA